MTDRQTVLVDSFRGGPSRVGVGAEHVGAHRYPISHTLTIRPTMYVLVASLLLSAALRGSGLVARALLRADLFVSSFCRSASRSQRLQRRHERSSMGRLQSLRPLLAHFYSLLLLRVPLLTFRSLASLFVPFLLGFRFIHFLSLFFLLFATTCIF